MIRTTTIRQGVSAAATVFFLFPGLAEAAGSAPKPSICERGCWGARAPKSSISQMSALTRAIVHHTAGNEFNTTGFEDSKANVRGIQNLHMDTNGWSDIGYHFLVDKFGYTFEGRSGSMGSLPKGAHDGTNSNSFGFNCMGYFHPSVNNVPTAAMMSALYDVIAWRMPGGWQPYGSPGTYGPLGNYVGYVDSHRRVKATACPGDNIHNPYIGNDVNAGTIRAEIKKRMDGVINPPYYFDANTQGWGAGNMSAPVWTDSWGWPGIIYSDQTANNGFFAGPATNFTGGSSDVVHVRLRPHNGRQKHDMQLFWNTSAGWKAIPGPVHYVVQGQWYDVYMRAGQSADWAGQVINRFNIDVDEINSGVRYHVDFIRVEGRRPLKWHLRNSNTTGAGDISYSYGDTGFYHVSGDWNGDGIDTPGVFHDGNWYLRNSNTSGVGEITFLYGAAGHYPIVGDWNGDGIDTIGVVDPATGYWYMRNTNNGGGNDFAFRYGDAHEVCIVGDWNGDGIDTPGVVRGRDRFLRNSNSGGVADITFTYGDPHHFHICGDWNGDGIDTPGVINGNVWYLRNSNTTGEGEISFSYGNTDGTHKFFPGDWNADGIDTPGALE